MKTRIHKILLTISLLVVAMMTTSCYNYGKMEVLSYSLESLAPKGLRAADFEISLVIKNPAARLEIKDIEISITRLGTDFCTASIPEVVIAGKQTSVCPVCGRASLAKGVSIMDLMSLGKANMSDFKVTVTCQTKPKGLGYIRKSWNEVALDELLEMFGN